MAWIDDCSSEELRFWLQRTACPMLASGVDGSIYWCNPAFEHLVDYSLNELTRKERSITWHDLTVSRDDLDADISLAKDTAAGIRSEYQLTKQYRRKNGTPIDVMIHVMRFPLAGEMKTLLVSVYPLEHGTQFALMELQHVRQELLRITTMLSNPKPGEMARFLAWAESNPKKAGILVLFIMGLLLGDRVLVVADRIAAIFKPTVTIQQPEPMPLPPTPPN